MLRLLDFSNRFFHIALVNKADAEVRCLLGSCFILQLARYSGIIIIHTAIRYFWVKILFGEFDSFGKDKIFSKSDNCGLKVTKKSSGWVGVKWV